MSSPRAEPRAAYIDGTPLSVPVTDEVQAAIEGVLGMHAEEFDAALSPFGLGVDDICAVEFRRVIRADEIQILNHK